MKKIFTTLWLLFSLQSISQTVHYVNDNATGANNGTSWANAFSKLQDALVKAVSGEQVWVAEGIYYPDEGVGYTDNNPSHSFRLKNGVAIYGGFAGTETNLSKRNWNTYVTTLSGDIEQNGTLANNSYHVVASLAENNTAVLDGFTITEGFANGGDGGGIYTLASSPIIRNCTISGNSSNSKGSGVYNSNSSPSFINCIISENDTGGEYGSGGGVYNDKSSAQFINCTITGNYSSLEGGGVYNSNSSPRFINCNIFGNEAGGMERGNCGGGGVFNNNSTAHFINCTISNNSVYSLNYFLSAGGGVFNSFSSSQFTNCTISGNYAEDGGESIMPDLILVS